MKVFIENEAGTKLKNIYDEKKLKFKKSIEVSRAYPYPYGFILNTTSEDGDNVDVFVLTKKHLKRGELVDIEIIGLMEQFEKSWDETKQDEEIDHNIIARLRNDGKIEFDNKVKNELREFVLHVFDNIRIHKTRIGEFRDKEVAITYIEASKDS